MSFLAPAFLMALPLAAVPLLIHLFNRRQRDVIRWGAMDFLFASATPRRRFMRLRDLLLLLLRTALVLAMIIALARPMVSLSWVGPSGPRDVILILDNSMSTARKLGASPVFDREVDEAERALDGLGPGDFVRVLLTSPTPEWLTDTAVSADAGNRATLVESLRKLKPVMASADMLKCMQESVKAEAVGKDLTRTITFITDGQATGWHANAPAGWEGIQKLVRKATFPVTANVVVPDGALSPAANLAVDRVTAGHPIAAANQPVVFTAAIKNTGVGASQATALEWKAGKNSLGVSTIPPLQPGAGTTVSITESFPGAGVQDINCKLSEADDLEPDDTARFLLEISRAVPILIVEGEPESDPLQSDTRLLLAALGCNPDGTRAAKLAPSVFQPKIVGYQQLADTDLSPYQCIVLADVPRLPLEVARKLARHVNSGGGLWIAAGPQTDVQSFNQVFGDTGAGITPAVLRPAIGDAQDHEKFSAVVPPDAGHPATALLADIQRLDIDRARVYRRYVFDAGKDNSLGILLRAEGGVPLAVERHLGRGRIVIQSFPLGLAWSNLPLCHAYVVMVQEWLWYLAEPGLIRRNLQPGESLSVTEPAGSDAASAALQLPEGRSLQLPGQEQDNRFTFRYARTLLAGEYRLTIPAGRGPARTESFIVNRDPEESNLTPLSDLQMQALNKAGGLSFGTDHSPRAETVAGVTPPKPMAEWLLAALILFMVGETAFAFWVTRQRRMPAPALTMEAHLRA